MLNPKDKFAALKANYESSTQKANFLIISRPGVGKTHMLQTCPGPILIHSFDPGGSRTLKPLIDSGEIMVDIFEGDDASKPTKYQAWEKEINSLIASGFFSHLGTYCLDSLTTWIQAMTNYQVAKKTKSSPGGRAGEPPELQDYNYVQTYANNVLTKLISIPCNVVVTAHLDTFQDPTDGKVHTSILAAGKLKIKVPLLFDEVYVLLAKPAPGGNVERYLLTGIDGKHEARTRIGASGILPQKADPDISAILQKCGITRTPEPLSD